MSSGARVGVVSVVLVFAAGLGGWGWHAGRSRSALETKLAEAKAAQARLKAEMETEAKVVAKSTRPAPAASGAAPEEKKAAPAFPPRTRAPGLSDLAKDNPHLWNEFLESKRMEFRHYYRPFVHRMNLSPAQGQRFGDILADELARGTDINDAARAQGLEYTDPTIVKLRKESEARRDDELKALLGLDGFAAFQDFDRAIPARGYVDGLATELAVFAPLTMQQADALERALTASNRDYREGKRAVPEAMDWEEADRRVRPILTPEQFAVWQRGMAHNMFGGSRRSQELQRTYEAAVKKARADGG